MSTATAGPGLFTGPAWGKRDQAEQILREVMAATWPSSREAMAAIGQARDYLLGELDVHARLLNDAEDGMGWREFDPDLWWFDGDRQEQAVTIAAGRAYDAALALRNRLAEYQGRERRTS
jgi:hypothetical protein